MPKKTLGINYFPFDVDFFSDVKTKILRARYGNDGVMIYIYLLTVIYREGYFFKRTDDLDFIISDDLGIQLDTVQQVMTFLLKRSMFNEQLFKSDAILTSDGIQKRWQEAVKVRAAKRPIEVGEYWLLPKKETIPHIKCTLFDFNSKNIDLNSENIGSNSENIDNKVKKSKVKYNSSSYPYNPQSEELATLPIKENAGAFRRFVEEFKVAVVPNTDLSAFTLDKIEVLTDKFRRISWLGGEVHDSKWISERIEQIVCGAYDYSIDRDYSVQEEIDEDGEIKEIVTYQTIKNPKRKGSIKSTKQDYMKSENERIMGVLGKMWQEAKAEEEKEGAYIDYGEEQSH